MQANYEWKKQTRWKMLAKHSQTRQAKESIATKNKTDLEKWNIEN